MIRVIFHMETPVIISEPLHLDALLTAVHPDAVLQPEVNLRLRDNKLDDLPLPLKTARRGEDWVWCASTCSLEGKVKPYKGTHTKRKSREDGFALKNNVMIIGGVFKDWITVDLGFIATQLSFLAEPDDMDDLASLCKRVTNIGKLRGMGYGKVSGCEITDWDGAWRDCLVSANVAMRDLPASFITNSQNPDLVNIRPPYWDMKRRVAGRSTGKTAKLEEDIRLCS